MGNKHWIVFVTVILFAIPACSKTCNQHDPQQVAEAFWNAVIEQDIETAKMYVIPEHRTSFNTEGIEWLDELPDFPDNPEIKANVFNNKGIAIIQNWEYDGGIEMIRKDGIWWITK